MRYHCATSALLAFLLASLTLADAPSLAKPFDGPAWRRGPRLDMAVLASQGDWRSW